MSSVSPYGELVERLRREAWCADCARYPVWAEAMRAAAEALSALPVEKGEPTLADLLVADGVAQAKAFVRDSGHYLTSSGAVHPPASEVGEPEPRGMVCGNCGSADVRFSTGDDAFCGDACEQQHEQEGCPQETGGTFRPQAALSSSPVQQQPSAPSQERAMLEDGDFEHATELGILNWSNGAIRWRVLQGGITLRPFIVAEHRRTGEHIATWVGVRTTQEQSQS